VVSYSFTVAAQKVAASVSIASSANPSTSGQLVTFTASVSGSSGTPTGTVTFHDGANSLCLAAQLANGAATCTTSSLTTGTHSITAEYSGDASYDPATSAALNQTVNALAAASISLASSANPSSAGQSVTFTAMVSGSAGTPTGSVDFLDGSTAIAGCSAVALSGGAAACTTSALAAGARASTADYSASRTSASASSSPLTQTVSSCTTPAPSAISSPTPGSTLASSSVTFNWSAGCTVSERYFMVGTTPGSSNVFGGYEGASLSQAVSGLPTNGMPVYVRLMSWIDGDWDAADYTYTAAP
jgi:hypothetical protein